jgi:hypothetical protein
MAESAGRPWCRFAAAGGIVLAVALVFGAAVEHPFLTSHDDGHLVVWNPAVRAPLWAALRGAFTTHPLGAWAPLHQLSHAADHALFGDWAGGSVLVNLALHALDALLIGWLVLRLGGAPLAGYAAAMIFAVHPVQVEAVVWISQRKTVLSLAFLLGALHLWIGYARATAGRRRAVLWALSLLTGIGALLTKAVAVVLPLAIAALDAPLARIHARWCWLREKLPFALAAAALAWTTALTKDEVGTAVTVAGHTRMASHAGVAWHGGSPLATFYTMVTVLPRYLRLLLWPADLSAVYLPPVHTALDVEVVAGMALLVATVVGGFLLARRAPRLFCWYTLLFIGLLPVSQIVPQVTLMNDRYLYVPMVGAAALAGEVLVTTLRAIAPRGRGAVVALGAVGALAVLALAVTARARVPVWRSDVALWTDAAAKAPGSPYAWYNLGRSQEEVGAADLALASYRRAIGLDDREGDAAVNAGAIHLRRSEVDLAAPFVERGAELLPSSGEAQFNLALLRFLQGRVLEAEAPLRRALALGADARAAEALLAHVHARTSARERPAVAR